MLTRDVIDFLEAGPVLQLASRDGSLLPESVRAVGYRIDPGRRTLRVFVPHATAARTVENLRAHPRAAIAASHPPDHRSLQLKGHVVAITEADEDDRAAALKYLGAAMPLLEGFGIPRSILRRVAWWPAWAIEVAVTDLFDQTPGPGAGEPLRGPVSRRAPVRSP